MSNTALRTQHSAEILHFPGRDAVHPDDAPLVDSPLPPTDLTFYAKTRVRVTPEQSGDIEMLSSVYERQELENRLQQGLPVGNIHKKLLIAHAFKQATEEVIGKAISPYTSR